MLGFVNNEFSLMPWALHATGYKNTKRVPTLIMNLTDSWKQQSLSGLTHTYSKWNYHYHYGASVFKSWCCENFIGSNELYCNVYHFSYIIYPQGGVNLILMLSNLHPLKETHSVFHLLLHNISIVSGQKGSVCVKASDLFMLNGSVWVTAATVQKPFHALWSLGKSTKAAFLGQ